MKCANCDRDYQSHYGEFCYSDGSNDSKFKPVEFVAPSVSINEPDGIGWCSSCDKVHEVARPKCPKCGDWLIFAADDNPEQSAFNQGIQAAIGLLEEWNKRGDYIQSAAFFAKKLAVLAKSDQAREGGE